MQAWDLPASLFLEPHSLLVLKVQVGPRGFGTGLWSTVLGQGLQLLLVPAACPADSPWW